MSKRAILHLSDVDKPLGRLIERVGSCKLKPTRDGSPFVSLARAITYQQLNGRAAGAIWGRVVEIYGGERDFTPRKLLATQPQKLRRAGLSQSKLLAVKDLAEKCVDGVVPTWHRLALMSDEDIVDRLTAVRGIGPWTVEMLLIFNLGRPDVLPATDYGVQQGFAKVRRRSELPKPRELLEFGERWRPFRSYAAWYLWRAVDG